MPINRYSAAALVAAALVFASCSPHLSPASRPGPASAPAASPLPVVPVRAEVMVLGSYHMGGSGDYVQTSVDDVLSPRRQAEIEEVVSRLADFRPTRIVLEIPAAADSALNTAYAAYRAGTRELRRGEHEQIGFRLAHRLGHARVHAVDHQLNEDIAGLMGYAAQTGQTEFLQMAGAAMQAIGAEAARQQATLTVQGILRELNAPAHDEMESLYLLIAELGARDDHVGARLVAGRMERNLRIFANIAAVAEPGDRILVIYGSSHGKLLRQFFDESPAFRLVSVQPYLVE
jgi:hypothetical protein